LIVTVENIATVDSANELGSVLYDYVDPIALDKIVGSKTATGTIRAEFGFKRFQVRVSNTGRISVCVCANNE